MCVAEVILAKARVCRLAPNSKPSAVDTGLGLCFQSPFVFVPSWHQQRDLGMGNQEPSEQDDAKGQGKQTTLAALLACAPPPPSSGKYRLSTRHAPSCECLRNRDRI